MVIEFHEQKKSAHGQGTITSFHLKSHKIRTNSTTSLTNFILIHFTANSHALDDKYLPQVFSHTYLTLIIYHCYKLNHFSYSAKRRKNPNLKALRSIQYPHKSLTYPKLIFSLKLLSASYQKL